MSKITQEPDFIEIQYPESSQRLTIHALADYRFEILVKNNNRDNDSMELALEDLQVIVQWAMAVLPKETRDQILAEWP